MTPDLDRWSAEVMGWVRYPKYDDRKDFEWVVKTGPHAFMPVMDEWQWHPSQDANQVFMVVYRLLEQGFHYKLGDNVPPPIHYCEFWKYESDRLIEGRAFNMNPNLAILQAAHAALGQQEREARDGR